MNIIQSFVVTACAIGIIFSVISSMVDISKFQKEFRLMFTSIFLIILISYFLNLDFSFLKSVSLDSNPYSLEDFSTDSYASDTITLQIENSIQEFLSQKGIDCENISVSINITDENCISINRVTLKTDNFQYAELLIKQNFGESVQVINIE